MQIIYDDKNANRAWDSFRMILLNNVWHVVAKGYLCRVTDQEEGRRVMEAMQSVQGSPGQPSQPDPR
jgi:hypothetical protein